MEAKSLLDKKLSAQKFELITQGNTASIKVRGSSPRELFLNALLGMAFVQKPQLAQSSFVGKIMKAILPRKISASVELNGMDYAMLLVDFLSEVLSHAEQENAVFFKATFSHFGERGLSAKLSGSRVDDFDQNIKAVGYHQVEVKEIASGKWEATVVFEI